MNLSKCYADLFQMSYITKDMDAAVAHARAQLGIETFHLSDQVVDVLCEGKVQALGIRAAIANIGRHQFEIIQPVSGPTHIYTDAVNLDSHIINFHHIAIAVRGDFANFTGLLAEIRDSGDKIAFQFPVQPEPSAMVAFCYVDTRRRLGHYTEYLWWAPQMAGLPSFPNLDA